MKRTGQLISRILATENLERAYWRAARGKRPSAAARRFAEGLEDNLERMRTGVREGAFPIGRFNRFTIHDPKERQVHAPVFAERVLHHAIMRHCEAPLDRMLIDDSYACRRRKGRLAALERAAGFSRRYPWALKMDVRRYFDSIDHAVLRGQLERRFKDRELLRLFRRIVESYETSPGKGLPIGSLMSQHWANFHLAALDRHVKERLKRRAYVRYMDDFVCWGNTKAELTETGREIEEFIATELKLRLRDSSRILSLRTGVDFLGFRLYSGHTGLSRATRRRTRAKYRRYQQRLERGEWNEAEFQARATALCAALQGAECLPWRRGVFHGIWAQAERPETRDARRQLDQLRREPALREPEQERAGQAERQPGLPAGFSSNAEREERRLTKPWSGGWTPRASAAKPQRSSGVGSQAKAAAKAPEDSPFPNGIRRQ